VCTMHILGPVLTLLSIQQKTTYPQLQQTCKHETETTRSQAVARMADRTASQHLSGSHDVIGHVTMWYPICHFLLVVLWIKPLSLTASEIFNVECHAMVDMTLIRPLKKGQGQSFWYQSISHIPLPIGFQYM